MFRLNSFSPTSFSPISWAPADEWHLDPLELHQPFLSALLESQRPVENPIRVRRLFKRKAKETKPLVASLMDVDPGSIIQVPRFAMQASNENSKKDISVPVDDEIAMVFALLELAA